MHVLLQQLKRLPLLDLIDTINIRTCSNEAHMTLLHINLERQIHSKTKIKAILAF
uniref:Uncharacterized protein n=1 Tax=Arundo donax TaxID=35708 RepID=A0A0A9ES40_ARUDO